MFHFKMRDALNLQLLAEGDGGAGSPGVTADAAGQREGVKEDYSKIQYGKQEEPVQAADAQKETATETRDLNAEFDALIKGEYKDIYGKKVGETVQQRLKGSRLIAEKNEKMAPIMDRLASRYGVDAEDIEAIIDAIDNDDALYEAEAARKGLTVESYKNMRKVELENASLRREMEQRQQQEGQDRIYAGWKQEAETVKATYPNFDLQSELANEKFSQLLLANIDMKTAYEVIHQNEVMPAAMQFAAKTAEQKVVNAVAAGARRPRENGISQQAGARVKSDPSKLSFQDIDEVRKRVLRGERISF